MDNRWSKLVKSLLGVLLACTAFAGFLYWNAIFGIPKSRLETDVRSSQKLASDWVVDGTVSDTLAAFVSYPCDLTDLTFSVYVNRPGLSFGYFFRGGGSLSGVERGVTEYTVDGYDARAFISMNRQKVERLEMDDGNSIQVVEIDSGKPFAIVLPVNAGNIVFYDAAGNSVEYWENPL